MKSLKAWANSRSEAGIIQDDYGCHVVPEIKEVQKKPQNSW